jgi:hypothetical protein
MDSYDKLPDAKLKPLGELSNKFLDLGISTFREACNYVHDIDYGYNTNFEDKMIFFKEKKGTCTTKHAVIADLAQELKIPLFKHVCIYKLTGEITERKHLLTSVYTQKESIHSLVEKMNICFLKRY